MFVFEAYCTEVVRTRIDATRTAYRARFMLALAGQKLARHLAPAPDEGALERLLRGWAEVGLRRFLVLSGYWLPALRRYSELLGGRPVDIEACHLDSIASPSWTWARGGLVPYAESWLFTRDPDGVSFQVPVDGVAPLPFVTRDDRAVIHGGGWGLGTYRDIAEEIASHGLAVDVIVCEASDARHDRSRCRFYMNDPGWRPWSVGVDGRHRFPPLGMIPTTGTPVFDSHPDDHAPFDLIARAKAVVSKPGGATLIDSLASATPLSSCSIPTARMSGRTASSGRASGSVSPSSGGNRGATRSRSSKSFIAILPGHVV